MSFTLPDSARGWQDRVRRFVEAKLIPWEVEAELAGGEIPAEVAARHERLALELGLPRIDAPKRHGGLELPLLDQVAIAEQTGRVTNGLAWCYGEAQSWMFEACSPEQIERVDFPSPERLDLQPREVELAVARDELRVEPIRLVAHEDLQVRRLDAVRGRAHSHALCESSEHRVRAQHETAGVNHDARHFDLGRPVIGRARAGLDLKHGLHGDDRTGSLIDQLRVLRMLGGWLRGRR